MALNTRGTNTLVEGLRKLLSEITDLKVLDDADMPFLIGLETQVLQRLKAGADQALQPGGGQPSGGGPGMPMGGMSAAPPPGMGTPQAVPGLQQGGSAPNPDELRRVLQQ